MDVLLAYFPEIFKNPVILGPLVVILIFAIVAGIIRRAQRKEALFKRELMKKRLQA